MEERKTAVLTGATGRLGGLVAAELDRRGYHVVALVRTVDEALSTNYSAYPCDVTAEDSVVTVFEHLRSVHGRIDAMIHTVGAWGLTPLLETTLSDWRAIMDANLTSAFLCLREAARFMATTGGGGIVAIASGQGADRAPARQGAYAASKAGVIRLAEAIAAEFDDRGITARVVAPSTIRFDEGAGPGIPADELVRLCVNLSDPKYPVANGALIRAYGSSG